MAGFALQRLDFYLIALYLEGYLFGIYTALFIMYLQYQGSKMGRDKRSTILFCSICVLYILCGAIFVMDVVRFLLYHFMKVDPGSYLFLFVMPEIVTLTFGFCDFLAQSILIYRCWIVWDRNTRIVILPSMLAVSFLVFWAVDGRIYKNAYRDQTTDTHLAAVITTTSLALSSTVNALVTGLIVFKIIKVYRQIKPSADDRYLGANGGNKLRPVVFILVESGMVLCSIQMVRLVFCIVWTDTITRFYPALICMQQMITGIAPTIILVRVSMGLSFHDDLEESTVITGLRFQESNHQTSTSDTGSTKELSGDERIHVLETSDDNDTSSISPSLK